MTYKIIFANLLIDSLWDNNGFLEKIFDVKSPNVNNLARINEYLGQFLANDGDYVICPAKPSQNIVPFQSPYLNLSKVNWVYTHSSLNHIDAFSDEVVSQVFDKKIGDFIFSGFSPLEIQIVKKLKMVVPDYATDFSLAIKFNKKDYLMSLSSKLGIKIPRTEVVDGSQITNTHHLYKSLVSSGGSGIYTFPDIERVKLWSDRKNLSEEWKKSKWLKQEILDRDQDFNCFGYTDSDRFQTVKIKYDKNRLSYQHDFDFELETKTGEELKKSFDKIKSHLIEQNYKGPFGFDSVITKNKDVFPIVDLNVRLNKSHVLRQIMQKFKVRKLYTSFYRLRFINSEWPSFETFWRFLLESTNINSDIDSFIFPVDASYWNEGKSECLIALSTDSRSLKERIDQWIVRFLSNHGGQTNE